MSSSFPKRRLCGCGFTCYLPQQELRQRATATLPRALRLREVEPGREQGGGWMSGRMFPPLATTDPRGDGIMQTATAPGASSRTFLIHMLRRGLDDNRYVVERYKSTFDGEIVRRPCQGKSKAGKQPLPGHVARRRAADAARAGRDHRLHRREDRRLRHPVLGIGGNGPVRGAQAQGLLNGLPPGMSRRPQIATDRPGVLRPDHNRGREEHALQRPRERTRVRAAAL